MSSKPAPKGNKNKESKLKPKQNEKKSQDQIKEKNLRAIERMDPFVEDIITQAANSAVFEFDVEQKKWIKSDIDGTLFVYSRIDMPYYSFMVANRQSLNDFIHPITPTLKLKYTPPYILMYKPDGVIKCVWIYGEDECKRIYKILLALREKANQPTTQNKF